MFADPEGYMPEWLKWTIGVGVIALSIIVIPFTGGTSSAFIPITIGAAVGAATGFLGGLHTMKKDLGLIQIKLLQV